jgi:hypothetical protein
MLTQQKTRQRRAGGDLLDANGISDGGGGQ